MDVSTWYAAGVFSAIALCMLRCMFFRVGRTVYRLGKRLFLKYLKYSQTLKFFGYSLRVTRFECFLFLSILTINIAVITIGVHDRPKLAVRSGMASVVNIVPLFLGPQMSLIADSFHVSLGSSARIHRWLGAIAITEGVLHAATSFSLQKPEVSKREEVSGFLAAVILVSIPMSGLLLRQAYEIFNTLHLICFTTLLAALYLHRPTPSLTPPTIYLLVAVCLQVLTGGARFVHFVYRNVKHKRPLSRAIIKPIHYTTPFGEKIAVLDAVHLHVRLTRGWTHQAGQYVYLCVPGVSQTSFLQLHPFYIAWWYREGEFDYAVFIIKKYQGFTKKLVECQSKDSETTEYFTALVEGPYGKELTLDLYGTVLLFATGIGIAGQLSYVSQLLREYQSYETKTKRIALFWQVQSEVHLAYVANQMQELLEQDTGRVLEIHIYVLSNFVSQHTRAEDFVKLGERIGIKYGALEVTNVLDLEVSQRKGRTAICLCADDKVAVAVRTYIASTGDECISLKELDFQPDSYSEGSLRRAAGLLAGIYTGLCTAFANNEPR